MGACAAIHSLQGRLRAKHEQRCEADLPDGQTWCDILPGSNVEIKANTQQQPEELQHQAKESSASTLSFTEQQSGRGTDQQEHCSRHSCQPGQNVGQQPRE